MNPRDDLKTEKFRQEGLNDIRNISKRDLFVSGIAMYLSEGATSESSEEVSFTNSDFRTIIFIKKWFMEIQHGSHVSGVSGFPDTDDRQMQRTEGK